MTQSTLNLPEIVSRDRWLAARKALLAKEKAFTEARDELSAERRRLPMVRVDKAYRFEGPSGKASLDDLFEGRRQLIVYHFMFQPEWDAGCTGCSLLIDHVGHLSHLHARNTTLALVSRAPLDALERYKARMGWDLPWYSSGDGDFNYDFNATIDKSRGATVFNYRDASAEMPDWDGSPADLPGLSVFLRDGSDVFHTYSTYARGGDLLLGVYNYLDLTALGRQEDWEQPAGRSDGPFMHWLRRHDEYDKPAGACCH